jgi:outer membrane protein assembly factor BamB
MSSLQEKIVKSAIFFLPKRLYYDFTSIVNDGEDLREIIESLYQLVRSYDGNTVVGSGYGGAQLCSALVAAHPELRSVIIRSIPHEKQFNRRVEGKISAATRAVFVDDAIYQGNTLRDTLSALGNDAQKVIGAAVLYDGWEYRGTKQIEQQFFPVRSVVNRRDVGLTRDALGSGSCQIKKHVRKASSLLWADYDGNRSHWKMKSSPTIYQETLINAIDSYSLRGYDLLSGDQTWEYIFHGRDVQTSKGIVQDLKVSIDGFLYVASYDGTVVKLDPLSGKLEWVVKLDMYIHATPVYDNGRLVINTEEWQPEFSRGGGHVRCISANDGRPIWSYQHADYAPSTVSISKGKVFATANDSSIICLDLDTGELEWRTGLDAPSKSPALVHQDSVYLIDLGGKLYRIDHHSGEILKTVNKAVSSGWLVRPVMHDGMIVVYDSTDPAGQYMCGYDPTTFARCWITKLRSACVGTILLSNHEMLVASMETELAYFNGREKIWEIKGIPGCKLASSPVYCNKHDLIAYNMYTGGLQVYKINDNLDSSS